ncbi:hypothetical protein [Ruminococcus sp. 5_1_39BFAA]|uniref:hypothetical protein n=1 Tax=Ruminococcus sp. 5_1_39BFAA TaxID=457412 RepID=UPI003563D744
MTSTNGSFVSPQPNRTYKARIFEMVFSDKKELLELYNAVNGTHYDDPEDLVVNTLENAVYMSMRNDVSFIIDLRLNLYEHQSTYNPNLPLRFLMYAADIYSELTKDENLYGTKAIQIPTPRFVIFYNGEADHPDRKVLPLSALYTVPDEAPSLELTAVMLNINKGRNGRLMEACKTLKDYAEYTFRVRSYAKESPIEAAVERAITECIREGILSDFLSRNRAEAKKVSIYEYDEEKHIRQTREEGWEDGKQEGLREGKQEGIQQGIQQTKSEDIAKMMKALNMTADRAMEILEIPENEREEYLSKLPE